MIEDSPPPALITWFRELTNEIGERHTTTWRELFDTLRRPIECTHKNDLPGWSPAHFAAEHRGKDRCEVVSALVLDYDKATPIADVVATWERYYGFVHSTPSHLVRTEQNPTAGPRARAILPLRRAVTPAEHAQLIAWAFTTTATLGQQLDRACKDCSRFWFVSGKIGDAPFEYRTLDGVLLDPDPIVSAAPVQAQRHAPAATSYGRDAGPYVRAALDDACAKIAAAADGERNITLNSHAFCVFQLVHGGVLSEATAHDALAAAGASVGLKPSEILSTLRSAFTAAAKQPRGVPERDIAWRPVVPELPPDLPPFAPDDAMIYIPPPDDDPQPTAGAAPGMEFTDLHHARMLCAGYGDRIRYSFDRSIWYVWDGCVWRESRLGEVNAFARMVSDEITRERARTKDSDRREFLLSAARRAEKRKSIEDLIALARSMPGVPVRETDFDRDAALVNCASGILDVRDGTVSEHERKRLCSKITTMRFEPSAQAPRFAAFLERILPDADVRGFVQRYFGSALYGTIREHAFAVLWGSGANGKSTLVDLALHCLGDYAVTVPTSLLMEQKHEQHPTALTMLRGARLAVAHETKLAHPLDEGQVKQLTGGDAITARYMRGDFFTFAPTHKLVLVTNHKPVIRGTDEGIWRRIALVPFTVSIPESERDPKLGATILATESAGVMRWLVDGCLAWQRDGLNAPAAVRAATDSYRTDSDVVGRFVAAMCDVGPRHTERAGKLYDAFKAWAETNGEPMLSRQRFSTRVQDLGFHADDKNNAGRLYLGIVLIVQPPSTQSDDTGRWH